MLKFWREYSLLYILTQKKYTLKNFFSFLGQMEGGEKATINIKCLPWADIVLNAYQNLSLYNAYQKLQNVKQNDDQSVQMVYPRAGGRD